MEGFVIGMGCKVKNEQDYFIGWYFKQQTEKEVCAIIPAFHNGMASVQVITSDGSYWIPYGRDYKLTHRRRGIPTIRIGKNEFSQKGLKINVNEPKVRIKGCYRVHGLTPPKKNIMGFFKYVPMMPCSHHIYSMYHTMDGKIIVKDQEKKTKNVIGGKQLIGYIEGDKGRSFPKKYVWSQCSFWEGEVNCIMIAVAKILPIGMKGCTGVILYHGKEYHIATWLGAKVEAVSSDYISIRQGKMQLEVTLLAAGNKQKLNAPIKGVMGRAIKESITATVRYQLKCNNKKVFDVIGNQAGFEDEW